MSLEELLKDPAESSAWKAQRKKLIRLALGLAIVAGGLVTIGALLYASKYHISVRPSTASAEDGDAKALAQLMKVQREAEQLSQNVNQLRTTASDEAAAPARRGFVVGRGADSQVYNYDPGDGFADVQPKRENPYIPTGAAFQAQLLTPIKTSVAKSFVMAEVTSEYRMDMNRKILRGSRLIGHSRLDPVLKGVVVEFETLVTPTGIETSISGLAMSRNALPEIEGLYFSNKATTYGAALAFGFLSGFADASRTRDLTILGSQPDVNVNNSVLTGFSTASFQIADDMLRDVRANATEYVVVPAGERIFVALTHRYEMNQGIKNGTSKAAL